MRILAIETSCDETGIALVEATGGLKAPKFKVLKNVVASQIKTHRPFGGVVPNLGKREHLKNLPTLLKKFSPNEIKSVDLLTVTVGPGLEPALWAGITFAQELAKKLSAKGGSASGGKKIPLIGANHLEGHLYSFLLPSKSSTAYTSTLVPKNIFPAIALIVSGGHTILLHMESFTKWKKLGETLDDAAGEAYDKVARLLELPYPGGPEIEKLARKGNSFAITFPRPMLDKKNYDFSFSGLKTSVLYYLWQGANHKSQVTNKPSMSVSRFALNDKAKADVAASFEQAVIDVLTVKTKRAVQEYAANSILLSGGVAANKHLRKALQRTADLAGVKLFVPDFKYNLDNATMIAAAGYFAYLRKKKYLLRANGGLGI